MKRTRVFIGILSIAIGLAALTGRAVSATGESDGDRAWLGLYVDGNRSRVHTFRVEDDSPAKTAGIRAGDVVLELDGEPVTNSIELQREIDDHRPGDVVTVKVRRGKKEVSLTATLGTRPRHGIWSLPSYASLGRSGEHGVYAFPSGAALAPMANAFVVGPVGGQLGVRVLEMSDGLREYFHAPADRGVLVTEVIDDSAAAEAGLKPGDVILEVDGRRVEHKRDIRYALREASEDQPIAIEVLRDGRSETFEAEVDEVGTRHPRIELVTPNYALWSSAAKAMSDEDREQFEEAQRALRKAHDRAREDYEKMIEELHERYGGALPFGSFYSGPGVYRFGPGNGADAPIMVLPKNGESEPI